MVLHREMYCKTCRRMTWQIYDGVKMRYKCQECTRPHADELVRARGSPGKRKKKR